MDTVLLDVAPAELARRLSSRRGHFAGPALLHSQLAKLEPPGPDEPVWVVDGTAPPQDCVARVLTLVGT